MLVLFLCRKVSVGSLVGSGTEFSDLLSVSVSSACVSVAVMAPNLSNTLVMEGNSVCFGMLKGLTGL